MSFYQKPQPKIISLKGLYFYVNFLLWISEASSRWAMKLIDTHIVFLQISYKVTVGVLQSNLLIWNCQEYDSVNYPESMMWSRPQTDNGFYISCLFFIWSLAYVDLFHVSGMIKHTAILIVIFRLQSVHDYCPLSSSLTTAICISFPLMSEVIFFTLSSVCSGNSPAKCYTQTEKCLM